MYRYVCATVLLVTLGRTVSCTVQNDTVELSPEAKAATDFCSKALEIAPQTEHRSHKLNETATCKELCWETCIEHQMLGNQSVWYADGTVNFENLEDFWSDFAEDFAADRNTTEQLESRIGTGIPVIINSYKNCTQQLKKNPPTGNSDCQSDFCRNSVWLSRCSAGATGLLEC